MSPEAVPVRPLPAQTASHFELYLNALREGRIAAPACAACDTVLWPPRPVCSICGGITFVEHELSPAGTVYTCSIVRRAFHPWFAARVPYAIVVGDLGAGVRILGAMFGSDVESVACGSSVRAVIDSSGAVPVLEWRLDGTGASA